MKQFYNPVFKLYSFFTRYLLEFKYHKELYVYFIIFFCSSTLCAQNIKNITSDSLESKLIHAYNLSMESKVAEALQICKEVLEIERLNKNDTIKAVTYSIMGTSHYMIENDSTALKYYKQSLEINKALGLNLRVINGINNLGIAYSRLGDYEASVPYYEEAANLAIKIKAYKHAIHPLYNIGDYYIVKEENPEKGLEYIKKAEQYYYNETDIAEDKLMEVDILSSYGQCYFLLNDYNKAEIYFNKAISSAKEKKYFSELKEIYSNKAKMLTVQKRFKEANTSLNNLMTVKDSIIKAEKFDIAQEMLAKFQVAENEEKLKLIENEKILQASTIKKINKYNTIFIVLTILLLFTLYYIYRKLGQLKLARDKAQYLSTAKSDFYSKISHELRTPLYAVIELSNILLKENVKDNNLEYLESLKFSGNHLLSLINNVLELNKIESGKMTIENVEFNLKDLVTNIIDSLEYAISDANNSIELVYDNSIPEKLMGDSLKLTQIFINLISNAIKFTSNGKIKVELKNQSAIGNNDMFNLYFGVTDSGVGISVENQKRIFEDYYQEQTKLDKSYKGTGLGLSIVKHLLHIMGSEIKIESEINKGSTFYFNLPLGTVSHSKVKLFTNNPDLLKGNTFLVVDDNKINQLVTKKILLQLGLPCDVVDNGYKAIEAVRQKNYDCILMDINMPKMNGYQATENIRQFNKSSTIIALTASSSDEIKNRVANSEMDGFIQKPFFIDDFISIIHTSLEFRKHLFSDQKE